MHLGQKVLVLRQFLCLLFREHTGNLGQWNIIQELVVSSKVTSLILFNLVYAFWLAFKSMHFPCPASHLFFTCFLRFYILWMAQTLTTNQKWGRTCLSYSLALLAGKTVALAKTTPSELHCDCLACMRMLADKNVYQCNVPEN